MLHYVSEDPWPLTTVLGVVGLGLLVALWVTQQGKYLVYAGIVVAAILALLIVERLWVTDNERIEAVVYGIAKAAEASDADGVLGYMAPEASVETGDSLVVRRFPSLSHALTVQAIRETLRRTHFDYIRISKLTTNAGSLSRHGTAEFRASAMGSFDSSMSRLNFATPAAGMNWSFGFRETSPGVWKVTRITPINPPNEFRGPFGIPVGPGD